MVEEQDVATVLETQGKKQCDFTVSQMRKKVVVRDEQKDEQKDEGENNHLPLLVQDNRVKD